MSEKGLGPHRERMVGYCKLLDESRSAALPSLLNYCCLRQHGNRGNYNDEKRNANSVRSYYVTAFFAMIYYTIFHHYISESQRIISYDKISYQISSDHIKPLPY